MIMNKSPLTIEYHSKTHSTVNMDQRASIDGCLNYEGVPTDGCSQLYVGERSILKVLLQGKIPLSLKMNTL